LLLTGSELNLVMSDFPVNDFLTVRSRNSLEDANSGVAGLSLVILFAYSMPIQPPAWQINCVTLRGVARPPIYEGKP
jgi:hypothetical protein